jgi:hypothetical protein
MIMWQDINTVLIVDYVTRHQQCTNCWLCDKTSTLYVLSVFHSKNGRLLLLQWKRYAIITNVPIILFITNFENLIIIFCGLEPDKSMTRAWQEPDKSLTRAWQEPDKTSTLY